MPNVFAPRPLHHFPPESDALKLKRYTLSAATATIDCSAYEERLKIVLSSKGIDWETTPAFVIFHEGVALRYLVLCWWGNDNELFLDVSVEEQGKWISAGDRYSFCLWDMEVMWHERNAFIKHLYSGVHDIDAYRADLLGKAIAS
ncbi:hypothetical protein [Pelagicoccus sp. SDUM812003]|uniref:hypothetical protein n=1 Tax=Pelagicoccus sp. SDUM812003 TaxID=3041267 RepID=UPI00280F7710|nr:hypothetical protein [Pelagicoccus sp. SDUM812003]MDQ8201860.1 hypothetical protein [Pelagicoccus sp. SDUM812003]